MASARLAALRPALAAARYSIRPRVHLQCLHSTSSLTATPLPHPSVPGPPPDTPTPQAPASDALERVARKRRQAEMLKQAKETRDAGKPKSILKKRFWNDVNIAHVDGGLQVFLDKRAVRHPNKTPLTIPASKPQLATAIALEWDLLVNAQQALKTHYIPMTSLIARAMDVEAADAEGNDAVRASIVQLCMQYLSTDTLLCWAPEKVLNDTLQKGKTLRETQMAASEPIMAYLTTHVWPGVQLRPILEADSIMPVPQPQMTQDVIRGWCSALPAYELAGLERAILGSKSVLVAARLIHEWGEAFAASRVPTEGPRFGIEEAAEAASTEVRWQIAGWGEVEDTHDVEREDMKRQLGSVVLLVGGNA